MNDCWLFLAAFCLLTGLMRRRHPLARPPPQLRPARTQSRVQRPSPRHGKDHPDRERDRPLGGRLSRPQHRRPLPVQLRAPPLPGSLTQTSPNHPSPEAPFAPTSSHPKPQLPSKPVFNARCSHAPLPPKKSCCVPTRLRLFIQLYRRLLAADGRSILVHRCSRFPKIQSSIMVFGD